MGYAYTTESMLCGKSEVLEEGAQMSQRLAAESRDRGHATTRFEERARKTRAQANPIPQALDHGAAGATEDTL